MVEWEAIGVVLSAAEFGDIDAVITVLTEEHGSHRGFVRAARTVRQRATWQIGNVLRVRWNSRIGEQLGHFSAEVFEMPHTRLADDPLAHAILAAACAVACGAVPERQACPRTYQGLLLLLARMMDGQGGVPPYVRWELTLLEELGFGLDLSRCAVTGDTEQLGYVSPRTGRSVSDVVAGDWRDRLLRLPRFVNGPDHDADTAGQDWLEGLALTGHFLRRDAFGQYHRPLPAARDRLVDVTTRVANRHTLCAGHA